MAISVKHGVNTMQLDGLAGLSISQVRERVEEVLNMGGHEEARLNGSPASDEAIVSEGQTIEFVKVAGEKGVVR